MDKKSEIMVSPVCPHCKDYVLEILNPEHYFKCLRCGRKYKIPTIDLEEIKE